MLLRPRQKQFVERSLSALDTHGNALGVAPTGAGKTIMLSAVAGRAVGSTDAKACVLAHRDELTVQNRSKFGRVNPGITTSVVDAREKSWNGQVTFAMVPTLARTGNLDALDRRSRRPHDGNLSMKSLSPALQAHLDEGTTTLAWCWLINRADGASFGFTDHDRTLNFDGADFEPESGLTASEVRSGSDLSVDAQDAEGVLTSDRITETDILDGRWDNAEVEVWRVNWADTSQRVLMRRGAIGQIRRGRLAFVAEVRSLAHVLGQTVGRTFQATCDAALGDARCGLNLEHPAYRGTGAVLDLLRDRAFTASGIGGFEAGWFAFGTVEWTSGASAGRRAEVLGHDVADGVAILTLLEAPVRAIAEGDAFTIRAGCDKRLETCGAKFANTANFRGFPHIPGQDAILRYATKDGGHDGGVL